MRITPIGLLLILSASTLWAQNTKPAGPTSKPNAKPSSQPSTAPVAGTQADDDTAARRMLRSLPPTPTLSVREGKLVWGGDADGTKGHHIESVEALHATCRVGSSKVAIHFTAFLSAEESLAKLTSFLAKANENGLDTKSVRLRGSPLLGTVLSDRSASEWYLCDLGVMRVAKTAALPSATLALLHVQQTAKNLKIESDSPGARETVRRLLECLHQTEQESKDPNSPQIPPDFARMLIRHGWLEPYADDTEPLRKAVAAVDEYRVERRFSGDGCSVEVLANAAGKRAMIARGAQFSGYWLTLPEANYTSEDPRQLIVEFAGGSDPRQSPASAISAEVHVLNRVASWSVKDGFASTDGWRQYVQQDFRGRRARSITNFIPPHILMVGLDGEIDRLITAHGTVRPARDGSDAEAERFLDEAATALPSAAHLDLIGEYLFHYVFDSPDPDKPLLLGTPTVHGEIHQTAKQTIAGVTAGIYRGDCDDLAELYHTILTRQGKLAQLLSLPGHSALGFVEEKDHRFHAYVLQTGPPMEFVAAGLEACIVKTYLEFYPTVTADALPVSYRFAGENVRSDWVLGYRIFGDRNYADTMRDVQRDWHYHTYRQGVAKMQKLIDGGDHDPANFRELGGLARQTAQWTQQLAMLEEARKRTDPEDHEGQIDLSLDELMTLVESKQSERAIQRADEILASALKAVPDQSGLAGLEGHLRLAGTMLHNDISPTTALKVLDARLGKYLEPRIELLGRLVRNPGFNRNAYIGSPMITQLRNIANGYCETAISTIDSIRRCQTELDEDQERAVAAMRKNTSDWIANVAFHDVVAQGAELARYALVGRFYQTTIGRAEFWKKLDAVEAPRKTPAHHRQRSDGSEQFAADLPWIKVSVGYWATEIMTLFQDEKPIDAKLVQALQARLEAATDQARSLGILNEWDGRTTANCALYAAMLRDDSPRVRELLAAVHELGDKYFQDDATRALGLIARRLSVEHFGRMLRIWHAEVHHKPAYFEIAWSSFVLGAKKHALHAAEFAAECFTDDKTFAEELSFMQELTK